MNIIDKSGYITDIIKTGINIKKNISVEKMTLLKQYLSKRDAYATKTIRKDKNSKSPNKSNFFIAQINHTGMYKIKLLYKIFLNLILNKSLIERKLAV
jgi:hypothetical protein